MDRCTIASVVTRSPNSNELEYIYTSFSCDQPDIISYVSVSFKERKKATFVSCKFGVFEAVFTMNLTKKKKNNSEFTCVKDNHANVLYIKTATMTVSLLL